MVSHSLDTAPPGSIIDDEEINVTPGDIEEQVLDTALPGSIIDDAINVTLGDIKDQRERYNTHTLEAMKDITCSEALERDLARRKALKSLLERTHISTTFVQDMEALLRRIFDLSQATLDKKKAPFGEFLTIENVLSFAYAIVEEIAPEQASVILEEHARSCDFHYDNKANQQKELQQFFDARINALLISRLIGGLNTSIARGVIDKKHCETITRHLEANSSASDGTNALYVRILEEHIRHLHKDYKDQPVVYFSIGCGDGASDVKICEQLTKNIVGLKLRVIGFDPFVTDATHHLLKTRLQGTIVNREIPPGDSFLDIIKQELGTDQYPIIATERYALHHMGYSIAEVRRRLQGIPLISVEEPISPAQRTRFSYRLAKLAWDLLANYAFEVIFGGSWISQALVNSEVFGALYRRTEDLAEEVASHTIIDIRKVGRNPFRQNCIITYSP